jgi:hypothetical protein
MNPGGNTANLRPPWKPGESGNPNGRPKKSLDIAAIAREQSEEAMRKIAKLMKSDDEKIALAAANAVLDRAIGKPTQTNVNVQKTDVEDLDIDELYAIAKSGSARDHQASGSEEEPDRIHGVHSSELPNGSTSRIDSGEAGSH